VIAGRYSLDREIGRGGTGVVWLGRDEILGRNVALKRIGLLAGADSTALARAEREARLSAQLNHPHVVAVFDVVMDPDAHWLVMEYVDGVTLGDLVRQRGRLSPDEAAPLLWQAADALVAAHGAGIVHRDVKPPNILVTSSGQVKLTDFGIARIATDPSLTQTGMVTGSPAYLAPEVATGNRVGEAGDVWSLGATVFFVLAGRAPYEIGENVLSALYRIVHEEPPRLADAGWMTPLLEGTMVRDPSRRWTMTQVRDFLADPQHRVPWAAPAEAEPAGSRTPSGTRPLAFVAPATSQVTTQAPPPAAPPRTASRAAPREPSPGGRWSARRVLLAGVVLVLALVLGAVLYAALPDREPASNNTVAPTPSPSTPSSTASAEPKPTEEGIKAFIRDYVTTVAANPDAAWQMLSPKFQVESGGINTYRRFWGPATNGRVVSISANPDNLSVSYQVLFDNFDNGPGPTVLDLEFEDGRYLIDGERTQGFTPAG
jgi:serine/threonine protein kinase